MNPILIDIPGSLRTDRLDLRAPRAGDGAAVFAAISDSLAELRRFLASLPWVAGEQSVDASEAYCRNAHSNFVARRDFPFLVFERASATLVGSVGLHRPDWNTPKIEVGYWCRTAHTGHGFIGEAVRAMLDLAWGPLGMARIELITDELNTASRRVAERCGFRLEGVLHHERRAPDGTLRNTCVYAQHRTAPGPAPPPTPR